MPRRCERRTLPIELIPQTYEHKRGHLSVAQLVERGTVNGQQQQRSLGRWFESIPGDPLFISEAGQILQNLVPSISLIKLS